MMLVVILSTTLGVVYSAITKEVGDGFSIASYVITAVGFMVAVFTGGEWFGLEAPDSFGESSMPEEHERVVGRATLDIEEFGHGEEKLDV